MKTYARIIGGVVQEVIAPMTDSAGTEVPITNRFPPDFVASLVDATSASPQPQQGWAYGAGAFSAPVGPTLAEAQSAQVAKMGAACRAAILAGFASSALGTEHSHPSQDADQRNLQSAVSASIGAAATWTTPIWCASAGSWSLVSHSAAQVQQVNADWLAFRVAAQQKYANLIAKINAATSVTAVQAITW